MAKKSGLTPANITAIQQYVRQGYAVKDISEIMDKPPATIYRWLEKLDLKIGQKPPGDHTEEGDQEDEKKEPDLEERIKVETEKKHVTGISTRLSKLTIDREMDMRDVAATLEKHASIFESVRNMGMSIPEFLDLAITLTYDDAKAAFLVKVEQIEEDAIRDQAIRMLKGVEENAEIRN